MSLCFSSLRTYPPRGRAARCQRCPPSIASLGRHQVPLPQAAPRAELPTLGQHRSRGVDTAQQLSFPSASLCPSSLLAASRKKEKTKHGRRKAVTVSHCLPGCDTVISEHSPVATEQHQAPARCLCTLSLRQTQVTSRECCTQFTALQTQSGMRLSRRLPSFSSSDSHSAHQAQPSATPTHPPCLQGVCVNLPGKAAQGAESPAPLCSSPVRRRKGSCT